MAAPVTLFRQTPEGEQAVQVDVDTARRLAQNNPGEFSVDPNERIFVDVGGGQEQEMRVGDYFQQYGTGFNPEAPRTFGEQQVQARQERAEFTSVPQTAAAFGEGVASGLTFGLSRALLEGEGEYGQAAERRQQYNPVASGAGEVTGMLLPALATAGASAPVQGAGTAVRGAQAARTLTTGGRIANTLRYSPAGASYALATAAEGKLAQQGLSKAAQLAVGGAIDGGLSMGTYAVSEGIRNDEDLSQIAQSAFFEGGAGLLGGAAFGGVIGKAFPGAEASTKALKPQAALDDFAKPFNAAINPADYQALRKTARGQQVADDLFEAFKRPATQDELRTFQQALEQYQSILDNPLTDQPVVVGAASEISDAARAQAQRNANDFIQQYGGLERVRQAIDTGNIFEPGALGYQKAVNLQRALDEKLGAKVLTDADEGFGFITAMKQNLDNYVQAETKAAEQARRAQSSYVAKAADGFKREQFLKSLGGDKAVLNRLAKTGDPDDILNMMMRNIEDLKTKEGKPLIQAFKTTEELLDGFRVAKEDIGSQIGKAVDKVDDNPAVRQAVEDGLRDLVKRFDDDLAQMERAGLDPDGIKKAKGVVDKLRERTDVFDLERTKFSLKELWQWRQDLDAVLRKPGVVDVLDPGKPALMKVRGEVEDVITEQVGRAIDNNPTTKAEIGLPYRELKEKYRSLRLAEQMLENGKNKGMGNQFFSLGDQLAGVTGGVTAGVGSVAREFGQAALGGTGPSAGSVGAIGLLTGADPTTLIAATLGTAVGRGVNKVWRERGSSFMYRAMQGGPGIDVASRIGVTLRPGYIGKRSVTIGGKFAYDKFFGDGKDPNAEYSKINSKLDDEYADLKTRLESGVLPPLENKMAENLLDALEYLQNERPVKPGESLDPLQPKMNQQKADPVSIKRYLDKVQVVNDPKVIFDHLGNNTLNTNHVQALRQCYPEIYAQMQQGIVQAVQNTNEPIPPAKRYQFSLLLNEPTSYGQKNLDSIQQTFMYEPPQTQPLEGSGVAELPTEETTFSLA